MRQIATWAFWSTVISSGFRLGTPIALAALGEAIAELSGVLNLGLEGFMLGGALTALYVGSVSTWWIGLLAGVGAGVTLSALMALLSVRGRASQIVIGFGITILGVGATGYVYGVTTPIGAEPVQVPPLRFTALPGLSDLPAVGSVFFRHSPITWFALALIPLAWWLLNRTTWGLQIRACGEDPDAASARGVDVMRVRTLAVLLAGAMAGLAGATLTVGLLGFFLPNMTAGRGFVAIAVVLMARWHPVGVAGGALLFGLASALALQLQSILREEIPTEAIQVLPYMVTLVVLILGSRVQRMPRALGQTYIAEG